LTRSRTGQTMDNTNLYARAQPDRGQRWVKLARPRRRSNGDRRHTSVSRRRSPFAVSWAAQPRPPATDKEGDPTRAPYGRGRTPGPPSSPAGLRGVRLVVSDAERRGRGCRGAWSAFGTPPWARGCRSRFDRRPFAARTHCSSIEAVPMTPVFDFRAANRAAISVLLAIA
jgi:hypothetical protein